MNELLNDLHDSIAKHQVVALVGAGVSIGATNGDPLASWPGLLESGVDRCEVVASDLPDGWGDRVRTEINSGDIDDLLSAPEKVTQELGGRDGGEYGRWLKESVGGLQPEKRDVLEALLDLDVPLMTTNYDGLLETVTDLDPVTWRDGARRIEPVLRGDERAVFHLHGFWRDPGSVVLGVRSYEEVLGDPFAQVVEQALTLMKSWLFIGVGRGLADPNFSALRRWMKTVRADSPYRHFRIAHEGELAQVRAEHEQGERVMVVSYGLSKEDLAPFLRSLVPRSPATPERTSPRVGTSFAGRLPPRPRCFGREELVGQLAEALLHDEAAPVAVLGPPGIGKSTLCLATLHDPHVAERFGSRRYFVRCDGAASAEALVGEVATAIGVELGPQLASRVLSDLEVAPSVLVLDNAETPWEADTLSTGDLLSVFADVPGLGLVVSLRGVQRPLGPAWGESVQVPALEPADARKIFLAVAGEVFAEENHLDDLLTDLDYLPLAVELLAYQAEAEPNLEALRRRWQDERVAMLSRADNADDPRLNLAASLELSIAGPRMNEEARSLLSALALLPDGAAHGDLGHVSPSGERAAATLRKVGLAFDEASRLRLLKPIRDHVADVHVPDSHDLAPVVSHYCGLAKELGPKVGSEDGAKASARLAAESANLEAVIVRGLSEESMATLCGSAAVALTDFIRFSGVGSTVALEQARESAHKMRDLGSEAACLFGLAVIALDRSQHEEAHARFGEALSLYRQVRNIVGEANCILGLGELALSRSQHDQARARFEEALPLYRQVGAVLGEANCLKTLGAIALRRSQHDEARARFEEALPLYRQVGEVLGEANCMRNLGDIALRRSQYVEARVRFEEALRIYRHVGDVHGEANCIKDLGDIALRRSQHDEARVRFEEALALYRQVGAVLGEANCLRGLGDIALRRSQHDEARVRFEEALALYRQVGEVNGEANCISLLGAIALRRSQHDEARVRFEEALALYRRVGAVLGEANCLRGLGDIALRRSQHDEARVRFEEALALYGHIPEPHSIGMTHRRLARVAREDRERTSHVSDAKKAWASIDRHDLIDELEAEFGAM